MPRRTVYAGFLALIAALASLTSCSQRLISTGGVDGKGAEVAGASSELESSRVVYLIPDQFGYLQLAVMDMVSRDGTVLTEEAEGLADYTVSPDGSMIVYTAWNEAGTGDIWSIPVEGGTPALLVSCSDAVCGRVVWSPDGADFIYERHGGEAESRLPVLWRFDSETNETEPFFGDARRYTSGASWSPDGKWFSHLSLDTGVTVVTAVNQDRSYEVPNPLGAPLIWGPDGQSFHLLTVFEDDQQSLAKLMRYDLSDGSQMGPVSELRIADREAAWSPAGDWLAVTRRDWTEKYPSKTQVWLMRADGSEAHAVLADSTYQYLSPVWSPDGRYLLFQRFSDDQTFVQPEVGLLEIETGQVESLLSSGGQAVWLP